MRSGSRGPVIKAIALEADPRNPHLLHVSFREVAGVPGFEADHLRHLLTGIFPFETGRFRPRIVRPLGIEHHLPEAFDARIPLSVKDKWRSREVGKQAKLVELGENDLARAGFLRQDFPIGLLRIVYWRPPVRGIARIAHRLLSEKRD